MSYYIPIVTAVALYLGSFYYSYFHRKIPGPIPIPYFNNLPQLLQKPLHILLHEYHSVYGGFVHIDPPQGKPILSITDPHMITEMLSTRSTSQYAFRRMPAPSTHALGMAEKGIIFNADLPTWRSNRRLFTYAVTNPALLRRSLNTARELLEQVGVYWDNLCASGGKKSYELIFEEWTMAFALDMISRIAIGISTDLLKGQYNEGLKQMGRPAPEEDINNEGSFPTMADAKEHVKMMGMFFESMRFFFTYPTIIWELLPWGRRQAGMYKDNLNKLENFELKLIAEMRRRMEPAQGADRARDDMQESKDMLSLFLRKESVEIAKDENGKVTALTDDLIRQNIREMFAGGADTIASTLCTIIHCLGQNPDIEERMVKELFEILGDSDDFTNEDLNKLEYTDRVIKETLRLHPTFPVNTRSTDRPAQIRIPATATAPETVVTYPAGTSIFIHTQHFQRDPKNYPDPYRFDPDRFLNGVPPKEQYSPFGGGLRICPGMALALHEMKAFIAFMYRRWRFELVEPNEQLKCHFAALLRAKDLKVRVSRR